MKTKLSRFLQLISAVILSMAGLLTLNIASAYAATSNCTWNDSSGSDNNFSSPGNWSCSGTTPGNGDVYNLTFPNTAAGFDPVDDIANLSVGTITFASGSYSGAAYDISSSSSSNVINISGGITDSSSGSVNEIDANLTLSADQTFNAASTSQLVIGSGSDTVAVGAHNLTLSNVALNDPVTGSGSLTVNDTIYPTDTTGVSLTAASPGFTGAVAVNQGALFVNGTGAIANASAVTVANGALLKGTGRVSTAIIQTGGALAPGQSLGCLTASTLILSGNYTANLGGTTACSGYNQVQISSGATLNNGTLQLNLVNGFTPSVGQTFEIINNSGTSVNGIFNGLAEGATFTSGGTTFQISYKGGDGNDVTLTVVNVASATAAAANSPKAPKAPNTGLAAIVANPISVLVVSTLTTATLLVIARRLKPSWR